MALQTTLDGEDKIKLQELAESLESLEPLRTDIKTFLDNAFVANNITDPQDQAYFRQYIFGQLAQENRRQKIDRKYFEEFITDTMFEHSQTEIVTETKDAEKVLREEAREAGGTYNKILFDEAWNLKSRLKEIVLRDIALKGNKSELQTAKERLEKNNSSSFQAFFHVYMEARRLYAGRHPALRNLKFNDYLLDAINSEESDGIYNSYEYDEYIDITGS